MASNLYPCEVRQVTRLYFEGKHEESLAKQLDLLPLVKALFLETNPTPVKYAMSLLGLCTPEVRLPLATPSPTTRAHLEALVLKKG